MLSHYLMFVAQEHSKLILSKEWLVKTDNQTSTPYLFKFYSSTADLSCYVLLTDTKSVWTEVLTSNQFSRRWRDCNFNSPSFYTDAEDEDAWRTTTLELLSRVHTLGGIIDLSFEVVPSNYADISFTLEGESFKWKWEACILGHKRSAEIISQHLIFPLISVNHLAFSSADVISELLDADIEKAIDKVGRTARRTVDIHIKNAISKPRVATTLRRMTAMFNFISDLPPVASIVEKPDLQPEAVAPKSMARSGTPIKTHPISPRPPLDTPQEKKSAPKERSSSLKPLAHIDSATESEGDEFVFPDQGRINDSSLRPSSRPLEFSDRVYPVSSNPVSQVPSSSKISATKQDSDSDLSPVRPVKKLKKVATSSDDDSEEERKRRIAQVKSGSGPGVTRGTRQPIKRGGKRF
ncbi:hypothetical protein BDZ94DRAFT_845739 [Collybia nuda]|uniref:XLF-like N-terminal domain-containing protein n=1 Tax=Collybia nuda TaxID=64659 RepID=A0A9P6CIY4_9AGAR|nr:hypothetical protein BDZ94DRAFT_845739 [Collybia nuda]